MSLTIGAGEILALIGPNGAGKSSIVMSICGLLQPDAGTIRIGDDRIDGRKPHDIRRRGVATVMEGHKVLGNLTVIENLACAASMLDRHERGDSMAMALQMFPELKPKLTARAGDLSGGQQQMISVAQAMMSRPRFVLADELSLGLAPTIVAGFIPVFERLVENNVGVLLIEQYTSLALKLAHRAAVVSRGRLCMTENVQVFRDNPHLISEVYLNS
jgi:branched-chain amino acid transport system ATP-binding protein